MTRYFAHWIMVALLGAMVGCAPLDQYGSNNNGPYYPSSSANSNGVYYPSGTNAYPNPNYNNGYPYGTSYSTSRYPSNGYETEYRKAQQNMNSSNSQAIIDGITQRMLSSGWYPEGISGNQLVFTRIRSPNDQEIYYKTVYTLVPSEAGYTVYANMKLKTLDQGSLNNAARNVDDKTESILKSVKKTVEQKVVSVTPIPTVVPSQPKPFKNSSYKPTQSNLPIMEKPPTHNEAEPISYAQPTNEPVRVIPTESPTASPTAVDVSVEKITDDQASGFDKKQNDQQENPDVKEVVDVNEEDKNKAKNNEEATENQSKENHSSAEQTAPQ